MLAHTTIKTMYTEEGYDDDNGMNISVNYAFGNLNVKGTNLRAHTEMDISDQ